MPNGEILKENATELGQLSRLYRLFDKQQANDVGLWMPFDPLRGGSFEVSGTFTGSCELHGCDSPDMPPNGNVITVGGAVTTGDTVSVIIGLVNGLYWLTASYVVQVTDATDTDVAVGLHGAIVAKIKQQLGLGNDQASALAWGSLDVSHLNATITIKTTSPTTRFLISTLSPGTETLVVTQYDSLQGVLVPGTQTAAPDHIDFTTAAQWIKAVVTGYVNGAITALVDGHT